MNCRQSGYLGDKVRGSPVTGRTPIESGADRGRAALLAQRVKPFLLRRTRRKWRRSCHPKARLSRTIVLEGSQRDLYDSIRLSMSTKVRKAIAERGLAKEPYCRA